MACQSYNSANAMQATTAWLLLATLLPVCLAVPTRQGANFVGEGTNELATAVLQGYVDNDSNLAISPFGISALLAIMAEGARGETRAQLASALHLPEDIEQTREAYHSILQRLDQRNPTNQPEFRNWFYVYKNFSVESEYKKILQENYLTEVKDIDRYDTKIEWTRHKDEPIPEVNSTDAPQNEESEKPPETEKENPEEMGGEKLKEPLKENPEEIMETSDTSQQLEEDKPLETIIKEDEKDSDDSAQDQKDQDKVVEKPVQQPNKKVTAREGREFHEITSGLSGNNIVGRANTNGTERKSLMIVFNGLYFKGIWEQPFQLNDQESSFYKSNTKKQSVKMMHASGTFLSGSIPELDSVAVELPYKGGRYSLLVLLPNSRTGLRDLTAQLMGYSLSNLRKQLELHEVELCLPSFEIQATTRPSDALRKFGVTQVFNPQEADLSGVSKDSSGLYVEELVQLVTVTVDEGAGYFNELTASNPAMRSGAFKFVADHPFLYFVRDTTDNLVIVAGKVMDPTERLANP